MEGYDDENGNGHSNGNGVANIVVDNSSSIVASSNSDIDERDVPKVLVPFSARQLLIVFTCCNLLTYFGTLPYHPRHTSHHIILHYITLQLLATLTLAC
jgi:hypothetical protein